MVLKLPLSNWSGKHTFQTKKQKRGADLETEFPKVMHVSRPKFFFPWSAEPRFETKVLEGVWPLL